MERFGSFQNTTLFINTFCNPKDGRRKDDQNIVSDVIQTTGDSRRETENYLQAKGARKDGYMDTGGMYKWGNRQPVISNSRDYMTCM